MPPFSFIHTADLHLDSPFSTLARENTDLSAIMRSATFNAFENIIRLCIEKRVDFLVIAGDVFDGADRSLRAQVKFRDGLKRLNDAGIHSFIAHGNHDPLDSWSTSLDWPFRVHLFPDHVETVPITRNHELLGNIQGISYPKGNERRNLAKLFKKTGPDFHIGLLHANAGSNTGHEPYAPCSLEDLLKAGMDYWALGHVHTRRRLSDSGPFILYPGNTQGRNINEPGKRGCYLVRVDEEGGINTEFFPTDSVRWYSLNIQIDNLESEQDLINSLNKTCEEISVNGSGRTSIVRIILEGNSPLAKMLTDTNIIKDLLEITRENGTLFSPQVWIEKIESRAKTPFDIPSLLKNSDFVGELLRLSKELSENDHFEEIIEDDISMLFNDPKAHRFLKPPDLDRLKELLNDAVMICLAELEVDKK
jgi:exonuclease SbcD